MNHLTRRPRRNRKSQVIRDMVQENHLALHDLIYPIFVTEGQNLSQPIASMPGISRFSLDRLVDEVGACVELGINAFAPFPNIPEEKKDRFGQESKNPEGLYLRTLSELKRQFPHIVLASDVALDPYSTDGHDGIVDNGEIINDASLEVLGQMALAQAQAGADIIAPSDMMDGRVAHIRQVLDKHAFSNVAIMSYTAKYASGFYGPFRDALESAPKHGDKKTYQMNPANSREALLEAELDTQEGADYLMVKPALSYLDVIKLLRDNSHLPIVAYNVSGEYAMVKAAAQNGWIDGEKIMLETLLSMKRAGADIILTYFAKEFAQYLKR
ncbi:porphobilinogen synthase [Rufibacter glacialis]|uniref:Delta-aminolevulinic acid dehydratase n=1 Tax=Rufibacter glacialis TaxID=1259555 RepID=A0A5M8QDV5_9BACT|nr:porphobilinogen synthase [Rufibacter glacialis]KAA6433193.1 porphobilinogen synthase [Rufibacter glacialis]GGK76607.1 delta-aminolevulinic acid dehydratase [Rufibacter glacialis]